jgi:hypothetical protein
VDRFESSLGLVWLAGTNFVNGGLVSAKLAKLAKLANAGQESDFARLAGLATLAGSSALERRNDWGSNFLNALILHSDDLPYFPPFGAGDHTAPAYFS